MLFYTGLLLLLGAETIWSQRDRSNNRWNPFAGSFDWNNIQGVPDGFGQFPAFGSGSPGFGFGSSAFGFGNNGNHRGNTGNRNRGSGNSDRDSDNFNNNNNGNSNRGSGNTGFGNSGFGGFGGSSSGFSFPSFDFNDAFSKFQNQFATQFPTFNFGSFGTGFAPSGNTNSNVDSGVGQPIQSPAETTTTVASTTTTATTTTSTAFVSVSTTISSGGNVVITNRNCTQEGLVVGVSPSVSDQCGSAECECFHGFYFCYSTCSPPPPNQTCDAIVAGNDVCPQYTNCGNLVNGTSQGLSNMFRCDARSTGPIHPAVCWMYEILYGRLTEPLGFFESVQPVCPLIGQCVCSPDGFVQPALVRQEDFKTPANNKVFPRQTAGRKGAFASS